MKRLFAATHESVDGTNRTTSDVRSSVAIGSKPDIAQKAQSVEIDPTRTSSAAFQGSPLSRPKNTIAFAPDFGVRGRAR